MVEVGHISRPDPDIGLCGDDGLGPDRLPRVVLGTSRPAPNRAVSGPFDPSSVCFRILLSCTLYAVRIAKHCAVDHGYNYVIQAIVLLLIRRIPTITLYFSETVFRYLHDRNAILVQVTRVGESRQRSMGRRLFLGGEEISDSRESFRLLNV